MLQTNWRKLHVRASITFLVNISERETVHIIKLPNSVKLKFFGCHDTQKILCWGPKQDKPWKYEDTSQRVLFVCTWNAGEEKANKSKNRKVNLMSIKTSVNFLVFSQLRKSYYIVVVLRDFPKITNGPYMKMSKT